MEKRLAYLGPAGTFSEAAAIAYDPSAFRLPVETVHAVAQAVEAGEADEGVVAIENSLEGSVTDTLDLLLHDTDLSIRSEIVVPISHCLIAKSGTTIADIKVVFSHTQSLGQCRKYLERSVPNADLVAALSNIYAVEEMLASERIAAAIAPKRALDLYDAVLLAEGIQDRSENVTRFVVLAREDHPPTGNDKTSVAFTFAAEDKSGQVYHALGEFAKRGINLSKIESRPSKESLGRYIFLVDLDGHRTERFDKEALDAVAPSTSAFRIFGSYPKFARGRLKLDVDSAR